MVANVCFNNYSKFKKLKIKLRMSKTVCDYQLSQQIHCKVNDKVIIEIREIIDND